jgi:hypothetical protein
MSYSIEQYYKDLEEYLSGMEGYPDCAGMTYPWVEYKGIQIEDKQSFILLMSLFVMTDLVFYAYFGSYYCSLRKELNTPKFEYGLTYTYYYPHTIVNREVKGAVSHRLFNQIFNIYISVINSFFEQYEIDKSLFYDVIMKDKDLNEGAFGIRLQESIKRIACV